MTNSEAVNWIINISADIGKAEHRDLWHYEQALSEIREMLESAQPEPNESAKRLNDLILDINPAEICSQIESGNLKNWCSIIQTEMKMEMIKLPCWAERRADDKSI